MEIKEDIILVDGGSSLYVAAFLKLRYPKIKIIFLDGDMIFYYLCTQNKSNFFIKFFLKQIDSIISVSKQNKTFASRLVNIPIKISTPYPQKIKKIKIKRKSYGLYIGRLDPDKKIKRLVKFAIQCPYFEKFIIIGDGAFRNYIKKISENNKKIIYLGKRNNLDRFYNECKFLIHIPDYDPHPCTTMEAALVGCFPIISKNIGTNYLFDDIFIVKNPEDFGEINKKIIKIIKNEKKAIKLLKDTIKKIPNKEKAIKNFKKIFNDLC